MSLSKNIIEIMKRNSKYKFTAMVLYASLFFKENTPTDKKLLAQIRTELSRLEKRKKIRKMKHGYYQIRPAPEIIEKLEDPQVKLHGIKLEHNHFENNTLGIHGISAQTNNIFNFLNANRFDKVKTKRGTFLKRWTKSMWWEERNITITIHENGLIEIFCNASSNPLPFPEFCRYCDFLTGYFQPITSFKRRDVMMKQVGINRDFEEQQLDGVSCITLHKFMNDWARVYQKDDLVRYEHHLKLEITLEDAFNSLQLLTTPTTNGNVKPDERRDVA